MVALDGIAIFSCEYDDRSLTEVQHEKDDGHVSGCSFRKRGGRRSDKHPACASSSAADQSTSENTNA